MTVRHKKKERCPWVPAGDTVYVQYHDREWGVPVHNEKKIFEFLVLESAQAGLSWKTVLQKRSNYRKAFANFDPKKVARFTKHDDVRLMNDAGIIRNRLKIAAAINNAQRFLEVQKEFGSFASYAWTFVRGKPVVHKLKKLTDYPKYTPEALRFSADLKRRGFKFLGSKIIYAHMQATGMVNDHTINCFRRKKV
jgi:DNA-3-methyladenine glycosylase I